jgi:DNA-binding transcriptional regulator YdaS (Cro superfamily)
MVCDRYLEIREEVVTMDTEKIKEAIKEAGGAKELASRVGVSYKTVLDWKNGRTGITVTNCIKIEKATDGKISRKDILPNYPWESLQ